MERQGINAGQTLFFSATMPDPIRLLTLTAEQRVRKRLVRLALREPQASPAVEQHGQGEQRREYRRETGAEKLVLGRGEVAALDQRLDQDGNRPRKDV